MLLLGTAPVMAVAGVAFAPVVLVTLAPAGEGAVVQEGLRKVAMYRDEKTGKLHRMSALCTHVSWSTALDCSRSYRCHSK
jgi:hypothetical protein